MLDQNTWSSVCAYVSYSGPAPPKACPYRRKVTAHHSMRKKRRASHDTKHRVVFSGHARRVCTGVAIATRNCASSSIQNGETKRYPCPQRLGVGTDCPNTASGGTRTDQIFCAGHGLSKYHACAAAAEETRGQCAHVMTTDQTSGPQRTVTGWDRRDGELRPRAGSRANGSRATPIRRPEARSGPDGVARFEVWSRATHFENGGPRKRR